MLKSLRISAPCFNGDISITPWSKVNFLFGANGSGKTSISEHLASVHSETDDTCEWTNAGPLDIRVFNRNYIDRVLRESPTMPGVFTVDDETSNERDRLLEIEGNDGEGGELARAEALLGRQAGRLEETSRAEEQAFTTLKKLVWPLLKNETLMPPILHPALVGSMGAASVLARRLLAVQTLSNEADVPKLHDLVAEAKSLAQGAGTSFLTQPVPEKPALLSHEDQELLARPIVGKDDATFADLVKRLSAHDWVNTGRHLVEHAEGKCPFCQQIAPLDLVDHLNELFDSTFELEIGSIQAFKTRFVAATDAFGAVVRSAIENLADIRIVDVGDLPTLYKGFLESVERNVALIDKKIANPSIVVTLEDLTKLQDSQVSLIEVANNSIEDHNQRAKNLKVAKAAHGEQVWKYFANTVAIQALDSYRDGRVSRVKTMNGVSEKIKVTKENIAKLALERDELHKALHSSAATIAAMNAQLEASGFTSFQIADSGQNDGSYRIQRGEQPAINKSLSEGEANFVAFLYFIHQIRDGSARDGATRKLLVVIDDPISSLDSDVLHLVNSLTLSLVNDVENGQGIVSQLFILTHNIQFHREASYQFKTDSQNRTYRVIRKVSNGPNQIEVFKDSPISTTYELLWADVRRAKEGADVTTIGLENLLRRILEYYFKTLGGGLWKSEFLEGFSMERRFVAIALMKWADGGSHALPDEIHYSPTHVSQELYLEVFSQIFKTLNHEGHYDMMMRRS